MSQINQLNVPISLTTNQQIPNEGPKAIPLLLDFSGVVTEYNLDLLLTEQTGFISMIQTVYIDLSASGAADLTLIINGYVQTIQAKAGTQGYYSVLVPNPPKLQFQSTANTAKVKVILINVPIPGAVWTV